MIFFFLRRHKDFKMSNRQNGQKIREPRVWLLRWLIRSIAFFVLGRASLLGTTETEAEAAVEPTMGGERKIRVGNKPRAGCLADRLDTPVTKHHRATLAARD